MQNEPMFQVQVDENEDTEWNDILRAKGVIPERAPSPTAQLEEALEEALAKQHEGRLEGKDLSDLEELEDDEDEEFLESYRRKRMAEMAQLQQRSKFGEVFQINKPEYNDEVTKASFGNAAQQSNDYLDSSNEKKDDEPGVYIFVHLTAQGKLQSRILTHLFQSAAPKFPELKFVEIPGNRAIENYPESNCPTLLIYYKGVVLRNVVTLLKLGGNDTRAKDLEQLMVDVGAVKENDNRLVMNEETEGGRLHLVRKGIRKGIPGKFNLGTGSRTDDEDDTDYSN